MVSQNCESVTKVLEKSQKGPEVWNKCQTDLLKIQVGLFQVSVGALSGPFGSLRVSIGGLYQVIFGSFLGFFSVCTDLPMISFRYD